jgi:hypothetical protein
MWHIIDGSETIPSDDTSNAAKHRMWIKKDNLTKAMIMQCIKADLVIEAVHAKHTKELWDTFLSEFSQTGSGLIMLRFRCLTKQLPSGGDVSTHIMGFQEAIRYLANAEFNIPSYIAAAILLSTLPSDPRDPHSWNQHVAGIKIDKNTTTLSSVSKKNNNSLRTTRPMHKNKSQHLLLLNRQHIIMVSPTVTTTRWKVIAHLSVAVLVHQKQSRGFPKRSCRERRAERRPIIL